MGDKAQGKGVETKRRREKGGWKGRKGKQGA